MAQSIEMLDENTLRITDTVETVTDLTYDQLLAEKESYEKGQAQANLYFDAQLERVNALLATADTKGVKAAAVLNAERAATVEKQPPEMAPEVNQ